MITTVDDLRTLFLVLAFVSIGPEFRMAPLREAGWKPIGVFAGATAFNLAVVSAWPACCSRGSPVEVRGAAGALPTAPLFVVAVVAGSSFATAAKPSSPSPRSGPCIRKSGA